MGYKSTNHTPLGVGPSNGPGGEGAARAHWHHHQPGLGLWFKVSTQLPRVVLDLCLIQTVAQVASVGRSRGCGASLGRSWCRGGRCAGCTWRRGCCSGTLSWVITIVHRNSPFQVVGLGWTDTNSVLVTAVESPSDQWGGLIFSKTLEVIISSQNIFHPELNLFRINVICSNVIFPIWLAGYLTINDSSPLLRVGVPGNGRDSRSPAGAFQAGGWWCWLR